MQISEFEYVPTTLHIPNFFFQPGKKYFLRKFWKKQLMCYCTHGFTNFEFELTFFVFAHYSTSLYYITIPNVPWGPPNVKVVQIALCLNFLMSSAELLFKAHTLLLVLLAHPEYLVAYLLHELLENFWTPGIILKPCGLIFGQIWPPSPLWTILLNKGYGLFVNPSSSGPHGLRMTPYCLLMLFAPLVPHTS